MSHRSPPLLKAVAALTILGTVPASVKLISLNSYSIGLFRTCFAALVFFLFLKFKGEIKNLKLKDWKILALIGVLFGVHWLTYFWSIKWASASLGTLSFSTYGIHLAILGWIFGLSKVSKIDVLGVTLGICGGFLIFPVYSLESAQTLGILSGIFSGFLYAFLPILHQKHSSISSTSRTFGQFLFAFPFFLLFYPKTNWTVSGNDWLIVVHLGLVCSVFAHVLWVQASTELSTSALSVVHYLYLPLGVFFSWLFIGEVLTHRAMLGAVLILLGNALSLWHRAKLNELNRQT